MPPNELPRSDARLHAAASTTLAAVTALLVGGLWWQSGAAADANKKGPNLDDMETIEASLAYKKPAPQKQPQKPKQAPPPEVKPEGVSHDETKKPEDKPKDEPVTKPTDVDKSNPLDKYKRHDTDTDEEIGKPQDEDLGAFDGSEFGFATETKGDPYFQALVADLLKGWEFPELLSSEGTPIECIRLDDDGKISDTLFKEKSTNAELNDSVEKQVKELVKRRNEDPRPVPDHLLRQTRKWICVKFSV